MMKMMEEMGFQVIVARSEKMMWELKRFSPVVNRCSVMVGAHEAGLTNEVFLPNGAVLIQIRPLGLEWVSSNYFGETAKDTGVKYLEYKIEPEESTLVDTYGRDHLAVVNPSLWQSNVSYQVGRAMYLDGQI
ncbi:EGF domain-specific O-linked N-acetylglucosamine transferase [Artemisia annua]|uniref:EGF domain-specific O-linked N-acetylglucosamine transferase n=1 Tax=Artemisia annua TaxID=35608 RepID=A0A2U1MD29_ARTAN|nr:EGF domain-specific O-linked N-acetylglucosamine transferase [Artemisia annua]